MIWSPLAAAYDAEYEALEAARQVYLQAVTAMLEEVRGSWSQAFGGQAHRLTAAIVPGSQADWNCVRGEILLDGACIGIYGWVGAPRNGPAGTFRLAAYVAEGPYSLASPSRGELVRRALATLPSPPGQAFDPVRDADSLGGENLVRLDTVWIPAPFDLASFRTSLIDQTRALIELVAIPVAAAFIAPVVDCRARLEDVARLLQPRTVGRGAWDLQGLAPWAGCEVVRIKQNDRAVCLGLDPIRRRLFLNAREGDPVLVALRDAPGADR